MTRSAAQANASSPQGAATPSFYIIDGNTGKKVPVYLDETDPTAPQWKVDTSEFEVTQTQEVHLVPVSLSGMVLMDQLKN